MDIPVKKTNNEYDIISVSLYLILRILFFLMTE